MKELIFKLTQGEIKNGYVRVKSFATNLSQTLWGGKNKAEAASDMLKINFQREVIYSDIDGTKQIIRKRFGKYMNEKSYAKIEIISDKEINLIFL